MKVKIRNLTNNYVFLTNQKGVSYNLPPSKEVIDDFDEGILENLRKLNIRIEILEELDKIEQNDKIQEKVQPDETTDLQKNNFDTTENIIRKKRKKEE